MYDSSLSNADNFGAAHVARFALVLLMLRITLTFVFKRNISIVWMFLFNLVRAYRMICEISRQKKNFIRFLLIHCRQTNIIGAPRLLLLIKQSTPHHTVTTITV